jgi:thiamine monophosphate synthase
MTLVALGGVDETNARMCREAGADAVAVIRAIFEARDPAAQAARLL